MCEVPLVVIDPVDTEAAAVRGSTSHQASAALVGNLDTRPVPVHCLFSDLIHVVLVIGLGRVRAPLAVALVRAEPFPACDRDSRASSKNQTDPRLSQVSERERERER